MTVEQGGKAILTIPVQVHRMNDEIALVYIPSLDYSLGQVPVSLLSDEPVARVTDTIDRDDPVAAYRRRRAEARRRALGSQTILPVGVVAAFNRGYDAAAQDDGTYPKEES